MIATGRANYPLFGYWANRTSKDEQNYPDQAPKALLAAHSGTQYLIPNP
jgi:hypothetical protein